MTKTKALKAQPDGDFAMWWFTPFGIIMPAACPAEAHQPEGTLQVRARDATHLDTFRSRWCPELGANVLTPELDYDVRAYVSADALALASARMTLAISARKFKPTTEGPEGLKDKTRATALHQVYNGVWSTVFGLSPKVKAWSSGQTSRDPNASSLICQEAGHVFKAAGGKRSAACGDCDARRTRAGKITYPKDHQPWVPS